MAKRPIPLNKQLVLVMIFGGATKGGSGIGITAGGKVVKIPPRSPLTASIGKISKAIAAQR
jgi:hypothetical protein